MRIFLVWALVAAAGIGMTGCSDSGVGRMCVSTSTVDGGSTISSPSLDCPSRICYDQAQGGGNPDHSYCTATCSTNDDCKDGLTSSNPTQCASSFVCAVAADVGKWACQQICVCKDDLRKDFNLDPATGLVSCPATCRQLGKCPN